MSATGIATAGPAPAGRWPGLGFVRALSGKLVNLLVAAWIFSGALVFMEPSPYEVMFIAVLPLALIAGVGVHRGTLGLFTLMLLFTPFALIGAFQVDQTPLTDALLYVCVTIFLLFTTYFVANYVADAPLSRMRLIMRAYIAAAVLSAIAGTLAYLGLIPGAELFLRFQRAKAAFQDPNVYGPFLMLPAAFTLQRVCLGRGRQVWWAALLFGILFVGVFVSFSRAAWGHLLMTSGLVFLLSFILEAGGRQRVRLLLFALAGTCMLAVTLAGLLSIPSVQALFETRASLSQSYDTGSSGRFGRQGYAFELALENPLGIGPKEFSKTSIIEEPHNTYVNVMHAYGWGGGLAYWGLILATLWRGTKALGVPAPNRLLMIPLIATYVPLILEAAIIDTDHWRHFFLITGLIWGVSASYRQLEPEQKRPNALALA